MHKEALMHSYASRVNEVNEAFEEFLDAPNADSGRALMWHFSELGSYIYAVRVQALKNAPEPVTNVLEFRANCIGTKKND